MYFSVFLIANEHIDITKQKRGQGIFQKRGGKFHFIEHYESFTIVLYLQLNELIFEPFNL